MEFLFTLLLLSKSPRASVSSLSIPWGQASLVNLVLVHESKAASLIQTQKPIDCRLARKIGLALYAQNTTEAGKWSSIPVGFAE